MLWTQWNLQLVLSTTQLPSLLSSHLPGYRLALLRRQPADHTHQLTLIVIHCEANEIVSKIMWFLLITCMFWKVLLKALQSSRNFVKFHMYFLFYLDRTFKHERMAERKFRMWYLSYRKWCVVCLNLYVHPKTTDSQSSFKIP